MPFLVIGGYAVLAHGYTRMTDDLDLLVQRGQRVKWSELLKGFGMTVKNDATNFVQLDADDDTTMSVDLMFVSESAFEQLNRMAVETTVAKAPARVVSLLHLIALKCHSFQHSKSMRRLKDMDDLIQLVLINQLDLNEPELRATILKHGSLELYEKLRHACFDQ